MSRSVETRLRPLRHPLVRKGFLVLDLESKDGPSDNKGFTRPFLAGVYDGTNYQAFSGGSKDPITWREDYYREGGCIDKAMLYLLRECYVGKNIYAHYGGKFDLLFALPWLQLNAHKHGLEWDIVPTQSSIQILDIWRKPLGKKHSGKTLKWRFLDSYKLMPSGLDRLGRAFGFNGKIEWDLDAPETDVGWGPYLKQDCVLLYNVLTRFHDLIEHTLGGEVGVTAPSTAMRTFRRKYLKKSLPRSIEHHDFVRSSYVGGRTEPFTRRAKNIRYYDINSSYPHAMRFPMPVGKSIQISGDPPERFKHLAVGFCECDVYIPPDSKYPPPLPQRIEVNGTVKLCFPAGKLRGVWDYEELKLVEKCGGHVETWGKSVWFRAEPVLRQMVDDLYPYRDKSRPDYDPAISEVVKILLNSLYGKFGSKTLKKRIWVRAPGDTKQPPVGAVPVDAGPDEALVWYITEDSDQSFIMPQVAAHVTAIGRANLWKYMAEAIDQGHPVHYCDTDSILTSATFPSTTELGGLKDEYGLALDGEFIGPKMYLLTAPGFEKVKAKGLPGITREELFRFAAGEKVYFNTLEKVGTLARAGFQRGPQMVRVHKSLHPGGEKRVFTEDGESTPIIVDEW